MGQGHIQLIELGKQYNAIEEELNDYKLKYDEVYGEYSKIAKEKEEKDIIAKKEAQAKIFTERTIKQQLDDTLHKFNRLLKER